MCGSHVSTSGGKIELNQIQIYRYIYIWGYLKTLMSCRNEKIQSIFLLPGWLFNIFSTKQNDNGSTKDDLSVGANELKKSLIV